MHIQQSIDSASSTVADFLAEYIAWREAGMLKNEKKTAQATEDTYPTMGWSVKRYLPPVRSFGHGFSPRTCSEQFFHGLPRKDMV